MKINTTWTGLKVLLTLKGIPCQFYELPDKDIYYVFAVDNNVTYECQIDKDSTEATEFETNYKTTANTVMSQAVSLSDEDRDSEGHLTVSQTFHHLGMVSARKCYKFTATSNQTTFYDIEVTTELRIAGGLCWVRNTTDVHDDDYIEFSIVDKDDVLGLFSTYGLTVGEDVLELSKFIRTEYIKKGSSDDGYKMNFEPVEIHGEPIIAGLYMRIAYTSYGNTDINTVTRLMYYEG